MLLLLYQFPTDLQKLTNFPQPVFLGLKFPRKMQHFATNSIVSCYNHITTLFCMFFLSSLDGGNGGIFKLGNMTVPRWANEEFTNIFQEYENFPDRW